MLRVGLALLFLGLCYSWCPVLGSEEAEHVTCGSVLKLLNTRHNVRLHSHDVKYGSGSGQQSVTGVETSDDANSYWRIRGKTSADCPRGEPIKCGQAIRLTHEVSAFGDNGEGDDLDTWTVQCSDTLWEREDAVRFKHVGTDVFLTITGEQYSHPIRGQREVHGVTSPSAHNYWKAMEGVFVKPSLPPGAARHDEL